MSDILALGNIIAIIIIAIIGFRVQWLTSKRVHRRLRWIKQALSLICLGWAAVFVVVLINFLRGLKETRIPITHSWIVWPMILITLSLVAASGIARTKTDGT